MQQKKIEKRLVIDNLCFLDIGPVNLDISKSECIGITGPSGAGKTLFLRAVSDIDRHTGKIYLDGIESCRIPGHEWRKQVGLLPSESSWWFDKVEEHFPYIEKKWFEILGFDLSVVKYRISRLSSGERQRLALLRLLCNHPKVILLDEPTANLDSANSMAVEKLLCDYCLENESAMIFISHDIRQLKRVSDRCFVFMDKRLKDM